MPTSNKLEEILGEFLYKDADGNWCIGLHEDTPLKTDPLLAIQAYINNLFRDDRGDERPLDDILGEYLDRWATIDKETDSYDLFQEALHTLQSYIKNKVRKEVRKKVADNQKYWQEQTDTLLANKEREARIDELNGLEEIIANIDDEGAHPSVVFSKVDRRIHTRLAELKQEDNGGSGV